MFFPCLSRLFGGGQTGPASPGPALENRKTPEQCLTFFLGPGNLKVASESYSIWGALSRAFPRFSLRSLDRCKKSLFICSARTAQHVAPLTAESCGVFAIGSRGVSDTSLAKGSTIGQGIDEGSHSAGGLSTYTPTQASETYWTIWRFLWRKHGSRSLHVASPETLSASTVQPGQTGGLQ